ncbi:signal transduction histidine-protein kinase/phosphatase UhpB [Actinobacillus equuli subsp. haemolyticus]|uniref:signal transduction histidine-protein kinase/phosphatase UhpB n=1 Tax=Actinobacillus equuli TaxID=718 RepID=UPI002446725E|nr:signal transduction histidine-protein kinase/phosphatase UhpB [Actinobacillus equuli]WGE49806.1 signal transduction histidine-protein kinase/phosphatase UhpB [Actinobacillus equuli subsp. haemolyticus]
MITVFSWFFISFSYLCLWVISDYLLIDPILAFLFLPFAFRAGLTLHTNLRYWWVCYLAEWIFLYFTFQSYANIEILWLYLLSLLSIPIVLSFQKIYLGKQWQKFLIQASLIIVISLCNLIIAAFTTLPFSTLLLVGLTGGVLMLPACSLIYDYVFNRSWIPLTANYIKKPIRLRIGYIFIYSILFILNVIIQSVMPVEFTRVAIFCLAIPIALLAFHYGWQGALLGVLLNAIALIATTHTFTYVEITDLLLLILMQTVTGIFLGLSVQYQKELNQHLSIELNRNKLLTKKLINTEEEIRKDISRELHDEIGQNITAIRMQSSILKKLESSSNSQKCADMIEHLSLNIYDTTKDILNRIRPKLLDDLDLYQAIQNLFIELDMDKQGIKTDLIFENKSQDKLDHILEITIYRLCQESLNNALKYAKATEVKVKLLIDKEIKLSIQDNGIGFEPDKVINGLGLKGMRERVEILDGKFDVISKSIKNNEGLQGTSIVITLPFI